MWGSTVIDVDVDLVGNADVGAVAAKAEIGPEDVKQHQNDDDEDDDCEHSAAASATAGLHHGRVFALDIVAIVVGHGNSPCFTLLCWRNERSLTGAVPDEFSPSPTFKLVVGARFVRAAASASPAGQQFGRSGSSRAKRSACN